MIGLPYRRCRTGSRLVNREIHATTVSLFDPLALDGTNSPGVNLVERSSPVRAADRIVRQQRAGVKVFR